MTTALSLRWRINPKVFPEKRKYGSSNKGWEGPSVMPHLNTVSGKVALSHGSFSASKTGGQHLPLIVIYRFHVRSTRWCFCEEVDWLALLFNDGEIGTSELSWFSKLLEARGKAGRFPLLVQILVSKPSASIRQMETIVANELVPSSV